MDVCSAGARPDASAVRSEIPVVNAITRLSTPRGSMTGNGSADIQPTSREVRPRANTNPAPPPIAKRTAVSVRSCRMSRPRPAPSDSRTAISRRRAAPRASRIPETFAHATRSTKDTIPISSVTNTATSARLPGTIEDGRRRSPFETGVARILARERLTERVHFCGRCRDGDTGLQTRAHHEPATVAVGEDGLALVVHGREHVQRHPCVRRRHARALESFGRNPDHGERLTVQTDRLADSRRVAVEPARPEPAAQHHDGLAPRLPSPAGSKTLPTAACTPSTAK